MSSRDRTGGRRRKASHRRLSGSGRLAAIVGLALAITGLAASSAQAAFPGENGTIVFGDERGDYDIFTLSADGSAQTNLTNSTAVDRFPAWSPDGRKIAFSTTRDGNNEIYTMNADGSSPTRLTSTPAQEFDPAWSPDGQKIVYMRDDGNDYEIYTMNADGSAPTQLTNNSVDDYQPVWSPKGLKLAYVRAQFSSGGSVSKIFTMSTTGSAQTPLTNAQGFERSPDWSPDGEKLVFQSDGDDPIEYEIYKINTDGSALTQIPNTANAYDPAWSPDGQRIVFADVSSGDSAISTMSADGSAVTTTAGVGRLPDWQPKPASGCIEVGFPCAQGTFDEVSAGIHETTSRAWVGGFEIVPRPGGKLIVDSAEPALRAEGAGVDVVFDGFDVPVPLGALPLTTQDATIEIGTAGTATKVLAIPVESQAKLAWTGCATGGRKCTSASFEMAIKLGELSLGVGQLTAPPGGTTAEGKLKARLENGKGFIVDSGEVSINEVNITPKALTVKRTLRLRDLLLRFERKANAAGELKPFWTGRAGIGLPLARGELEVIGTAFVFDGSIAGGGLQVEGINKQVLGPLFLQKVGGDLNFAPSYGYDLRIGATMGPIVQGEKLVTLDGSMQGGNLVSGACEGGPDPVKLDGVAKFPALGAVAETNITHRACIFPGTGTAEAAIEGTLDAEISVLDGSFGYKSTQVGFVSESGASYEGTALVTLPFYPDLEGSTIVSTQGLAACADLAFFEGGFGYRFGTAAPLPFSGCDLGLFRVPRPASAQVTQTAARATKAIEVPNGLPHVAFAAEGANGPPLLNVRGPGFKVSSPKDGSGLRTKKVVIVPVAAESKTYVVVNDPKPGRWTIGSNEADNSLGEVSLAEGLLEPKVKAKVTKVKKKKKGKKGNGDKQVLAKGTKGKLQLTYEVRRIAGQRVTFTERGEGIARVLGKAKGRRGKIVFKPTLSDDPVRSIEAAVVQNGLPREVLTVARFRVRAG